MKKVVAFIKLLILIIMNNHDIQYSGKAHWHKQGWFISKNDLVFDNKKNPLKPGLTLA